jgi:hypothetical protein
MEAREKTMVQAMLNSVKEIREVELLERCKDENRGTYYIVKTEAGIKCTAIFNMFVGIYYADDIYGIIEK